MEMRYCFFTFGGVDRGTLRYAVLQLPEAEDDIAEDDRSAFLRA